LKNTLALIGEACGDGSRERGVCVEARAFTRLEDPRVLAHVDTASADWGDFMGGARAYGPNDVEGWHITDQPHKMRQALRGSRSFVKSYGAHGAFAELGPGLYLTAHPAQWMNRAGQKWAFLKALNDDQERALINALRDKVEKTSGVSGGERRYAEMMLTSAEQGNQDSLTVLASPPFSIDFWKPYFLKPLGIEPSLDSVAILKVKIKGVFALVTTSDMRDMKFRRALRGAGYAGAISRDTPELVVFHSSAVKGVERDHEMEQIAFGA
jgi:hypothetical protein